MEGRNQEDIVAAMAANVVVNHYLRDKASVDIELIEGSYSEEDPDDYFESKP